MVILGILAIVWPVIATLAVDIYVGWPFLISGIAGLVAMFSAKDVPAFLWTLLTAALSLVVGVLLLWKPVEGAVSLTLVLTAFDRAPRQRSPTTHARSWTASTWSASVRYSLSRRRLASNTASL